MYAQAMWELYWYVFHSNQTRADRKYYLRRMIACGMTARQAIEEMQSCERES